MDHTELAAMGGKARAKKLTKKQRSEQARAAVTVRWNKARTAKRKAAREAKGAK
jgi:hypothetical protein